MTKILAALLAGSFLMISAPAVSIAGPINNDDGSQTCNASGPSGSASDGVCANLLEKNEELCDGGLSSEPGGGTTCAESRAQGGKIKTLKQKAAAAAQRRPTR